MEAVELEPDFRPGFCPRRECRWHRTTAQPPVEFQRCGSYRRKDGRRIPRFRCIAGEHTFSQQAFAVSYYLKRPELLFPVVAGLQAGSAHRQLARSLGCAPSTVTRLSARLGRHALLLQALALEHLPRFDDTIVLDHFELFAQAQYYPFGVANLVGQSSWFVYALDPAPHNRPSRRPPALPPQPPRGGYPASTARVLDALLQFAPKARAFQLVSDAHKAYQGVLQREPYKQRFHHIAYPSPKGRRKGQPRTAAARIRDAALFANDLLHGLLRHSLAHHRRETIAFGRRLNAVLERLFLAVIWRNFVKGVSERKPDPTTPAMQLGLTDRPWTWPRALACRLFPDRLRVPEPWLELYRRSWITPGVHNARHNLARAF